MEGVSKSVLGFTVVTCCLNVLNKLTWEMLRIVGGHYFVVEYLLPLWKLVKVVPKCVCLMMRVFNVLGNFIKAE